MIQLYRPNIDIIKQRAAAARDYEKKKKEDGEFKWGELREGDGTILRPLPPTNSRGILAKKWAKHYFNDTPLREIIEDAQYCLSAMFPDIPNVACPICSVGDQILARFPQLDVSRWHRPGRYGYIQAVDRVDPVPVARLFKLPPAIVNWLDIAMEQLILDANPIDLTDLYQGLDIRITKIIKKTKRGERTSYDKTVWSPRGVTPVAATQEQLDAVMKSMVDMDTIWAYPDDEGLAELNKAAQAILNYYMRKAQPQGVVVPGMGVAQPPGGYYPPPVPAGVWMPSSPSGHGGQGMSAYGAPMPPQSVPVQASAVAPAVYAPPLNVLPSQSPGIVSPYAQAPTYAPQVQASVVQPTASAPAAAQVASQITSMAQSAVTPTAYVPPQQTVSPQYPAQPPPVQLPLQPATPQVVQSPQLPVAPKAPTGPAAPTDKPVCFGGRAARPDGGFGYHAECGICLMCAHELSCIDATAAAQKANSNAAAQPH